MYCKEWLHSGSRSFVRSSVNAFFPVMMVVKSILGALGAKQENSP